MSRSAHPGAIYYLHNLLGTGELGQRRRHILFREVLEAGLGLGAALWVSAGLAKLNQAIQSSWLEGLGARENALITRILL